MYMDDKRLLLNDAGHRERGQVVEDAFNSAREATDPAEKKRLLQRAEALSSKMGCKGVNVFSLLPNVDLQNFFLVPAAHSLLYGVVRRFVKMMTEKPRSPAQALFTVSSKDKSIMRDRASHIEVTSDFGRRYRCVVQYQ